LIRPFFVDIVHDMETSVRRSGRRAGWRAETKRRPVASRRVRRALMRALAGSFALWAFAATAPAFAGDAPAGMVP